MGIILQTALVGISYYKLLSLSEHLSSHAHPNKNLGGPWFSDDMLCAVWYGWLMWIHWNSINCNYAIHSAVTCTSAARVIASDELSVPHAVSMATYTYTLHASQYILCVGMTLTHISVLDRKCCYDRWLCLCGFWKKLARRTSSFRWY